MIISFKPLVDQINPIVYIVIHCGKPQNKAKVLMMSGSITLTDVVLGF